jgi:alpha-glucuronidase
LQKAQVNGPECIAAEELRNYYPGDKATLVLDPSISNEDGYIINGSTIKAKTERGLMYGAYALLRGEQGASEPFFKIRVLNHWDNLDGSIERGYAGRSIFWDLDGNDPKAIDPALIKEYARANASIGINGTVLNNVNASPKMLSAPYIKKVKEIAAILRPYGIKVYLSVNFASPMALGKLKTADPLNSKVKAWWKAKASLRSADRFWTFIRRPWPRDCVLSFSTTRWTASGNLTASASEAWGMFRRPC